VLLIDRITIWNHLFGSSYAVRKGACANNGCGFVIYGIGLVVIPETLSEMVAGSTLATTSGMVDIRATYRGALIGTGLLLGWLASNSLGLSLD
jgi:hypothetical protein